MTDVVIVDACRVPRAIGGWLVHDAQRTRAEAGDAGETAANAYSYTDWLLQCRAAAAAPHQDFTTYARQTFVGKHPSPEPVAIDPMRGGRREPVAAPTAGLAQ